MCLALFWVSLHFEYLSKNFSNYWCSCLVRNFLTCLANNSRNYNSNNWTYYFKSWPYTQLHTIYTLFRRDSDWFSIPYFCDSAIGQWLHCQRGVYSAWWCGSGCGCNSSIWPGCLCRTCSTSAVRSTRMMPSSHSTRAVPDPSDKGVLLHSRPQYRSCGLRLRFVSEFRHYSMIYCQHSISVEDRLDCLLVSW